MTNTEKVECSQARAGTFQRRDICGLHERYTHNSALPYGVLNSSFPLAHPYPITAFLWFHLPKWQDAILSMWGCVGDCNEKSIC